MLSAATEAHRFSIAVAQLVFEVIGRRRGTSQLGETVAPAVVDQIAALVRHDAFHIAKAIAAPSSAPTTGIAVQRVHVQLCDPCVAEIFGFVLDG
ncbi:Rv3235 family protein [Gordonia rubripertincta]|uniref:Rv3235 family protein n=1 Tax=Gordonia rubripertincta TaxID=36822 RepID=UPI00163DCE3C|nr:Rv3235 family protein [Gordonia rubripertincta]